MKDTIPESFLVFDVESVGLHGEGFAVAGGVYLANGAVQWEFGFCCPIDEAKGSDSGREWVKKNIPTLEVTHRIPIGIRDSFWAEWEKAKRLHPNIVMAVECGWPVEANFLSACIRDNHDREWAGPYPLYEISSIMAAAGMPPMGIYSRNESQSRIHDPLCDARQSMDLLQIAIGKLV